MLRTDNLEYLDIMTMADTTDRTRATEFCFLDGSVTIKRLPDGPTIDIPYDAAMALSQLVKLSKPTY